MYQGAPLQPATRQRFYLRRRFELLGAILFAAIIPWAGMRWIIADTTFSPMAYTYSLATNLVAIIVALWVRMSVETYPGIRAGQTVLPSLVAGHALAIGLLLFARLDYHRPTLAIGFIAHAVWAYGMYFFVARRVTPMIAVVPEGNYSELLSIDGVDWRIIDRPDVDRVLGCSAVVADFDGDLDDDWERFLADCALEGRIVYQVEQLKESLTGRVQVRHLSENSFGSLVPARAYSAIKHAVDWVGALVLLPFAMIVMIPCAIMIRLNGGRPVLFKQKRVGRGGRQFTVYKFRTMVADAAADTSREAAMTGADDVRITRVGKVLRNSRLDELPQIFNILKGEMSFIGPRPEAEVLSSWYTGDIPFYRYRHVVRPGITGWAQVNQGHVAEVDEIFLKTQYDFFYVKYFSPWLDVLIVFRTIRVMFTGHGAR